MILKNTDWRVRLIHASYGVKPKTSCSFLPYFISALLIFPFSYPAFIWYACTKNRMSAGVGCLITAAGGIFAGIFLEDFQLFGIKRGVSSFKEARLEYLFAPVGLLCLALFIGIAIGICILFIFAVEWIDSHSRKNTSPVKEKKPSVIVEYFKDKKNKYCSQIQYTDDNTKI